MTNSHPGQITLKEILQQPKLWPTTLERVAKLQDPSISGHRQTVISGAGTSAYAAFAVAAIWKGAVAIPSTDLLLYTREELTHNVAGFVTNGLLVSLARSGDSPESVGVIARLQALFPQVSHLAITCNEDGQLARMKGVLPVILDGRTNDRSLVMTGSFSNLTLAGMAVTRREFLANHLPTIAATVSGAFPSLEATARKLASQAASRLMVLSCPALVPLGLEASLKVLEMTAGRVVAASETFLGIRHGPMSFLRSDSMVLCVLSSDMDRRRYEEDLIYELRKKKLGHLVVVGGPDSDKGLGHEFVPAMAPELPDNLRAPFEIVFPQLLAYHLSLASHLDPDDPSPDGVITRVVPQFRLHY
jgi:tagatose-6-phosphate ketose/aldose isomerase